MAAQGAMGEAAAKRAGVARSNERRHGMSTQSNQTRRMGMAATLLVGGLLWPGTGSAQMKTVEVSASVLVNKDPVGARRQALLEAQDRAVEQAVGEQAPELQGRVYLMQGRGREFVQTYRVLQEGDQGGTFQVRIEAQVDLVAVLRVLQPTEASQRIGTHLSVCASQGASEDQEAVQATVKYLSSQGLEATGLPTCPVGGGLPDGQKAARWVMLHQEAPAMVASIRGTQPPLVGATVQLAWELFDGGATPATQRSTQTASAFAETRAAALTAAYAQASAQGLRDWSQPGGVLGKGTDSTWVQIEGLASQRELVRMMRVMEGLPGVTKVELRRVVEMGSTTVGRVVLRLQTKTSAEDLGRALSRAQANGLALQVVTTSEGGLQVTCTALLDVPGTLVEPSDPATADTPPGTEGGGSR